jgi:hypothetical protein
VDVRRPFTAKGCNALGQLRFDSDGGDPTKVEVVLERGVTNHRCRRWEKIALLTRPGATPIP